MKIAKWYNNFQTPSVLMIDDLSDAYIDVYDEPYKNDWGYLCDTPDSSFGFLQKNLLNDFPYIRITFFVPYLRHNVINEHSKFDFKKYSLGERNEYTEFLKKLVKQGHEIAHHGSNHGKYIDENKPTTVNNWIHEWALFEDFDVGLKTTLEGVEKFKSICDIDIVGGKYCGYISIDNSQEIIDKCNFLYWCEKDQISGKKDEDFFGFNQVISFPTNFAGNAFIRLSYMTGNIQKDKIKKVLKYVQPFYNILNYIKLFKLYKNAHIISIQEHSSPSTTNAIVQSANIITDILSLKKIFKFLSYLSIWYTNAKEIAKYIFIRENSKLTIQGNKLIIHFNNSKNISNSVISIISKEQFILEKKNQIFSAMKNNGLFVVNIPIEDGYNTFYIK